MDPAEEFEVSDEERAVLARLLPESDMPFVIRAGQKDVRVSAGWSAGCSIV